MKKVQLTALYGAAIVMCGTAGFAQAPAQQAPAAEPSTTIVGCVVREADYRRTADAGRGGVAGTGIGAGNEFVLINASAKAAATRGGSGRRRGDRDGHKRGDWRRHLRADGPE